MTLNYGEWHNMGKIDSIRRIIFTIIIPLPRTFEPMAKAFEEHHTCSDSGVISVLSSCLIIQHMYRLQNYTLSSFFFFSPRYSLSLNSPNDSTSNGNTDSNVTVKYLAHSNVQCSDNEICPTRVTVLPFLNPTSPPQQKK